MTIRTQLRRLRHAVLGIVMPLTAVSGPAEHQSNQKLALASLKVGTVAYSETDRQLSIQFSNGTNQTLTAWAFQVFVDGELRLDVPRDFYITSELEQFTGENARTVAPGRTKTDKVDFRMPQGATSVTARVSAAIFANREAIGDATAINKMFEDRRRDKAALAAILPQLRTLQAGGNVGAQTLGKFLEGVNPQVPAGQARISGTLKEDIELITAESPIDQVRFAAMVERYERYYKAALRHAR